MFILRGRVRRSDELLCRNERYTALRGSHPRPFRALKEEKPILLNRATQRIAELIAREDTAWKATRVVVIAVGCQR